MDAYTAGLILNKLETLLTRSEKITRAIDDKTIKIELNELEALKQSHDKLLQEYTEVTQKLHSLQSAVMAACERTATKDYHPVNAHDLQMMILSLREQLQNEKKGHTRNDLRQEIEQLRGQLHEQKVTRQYNESVASYIEQGRLANERVVELEKEVKRLIRNAKRRKGSQ